MARRMGDRWVRRWGSSCVYSGSQVLADVFFDPADGVRDRASGRSAAGDRRWIKSDGHGLGLRVQGHFLGSGLAAFQLAASGIMTGFGGCFLGDGKVVPPCFVRADGGRDHEDWGGAGAGDDGVGSGTLQSGGGEARC